MGPRLESPELVWAQHAGKTKTAPVLATTYTIMRVGGKYAVVDSAGDTLLVEGEPEVYEIGCIAQNAANFYNRHPRRPA